MTKATVIRSAEAPVQCLPWGSMQWLVNGQTAPGSAMTLGRVTFKPGQSNPSHAHPNCDEILLVVKGTVEHTLPQGGTVRLEAGDSIVLPQGCSHTAKNVGSTDAVVIVAFNSPERRTDVKE
ncbi:MAG: cupin domain-containing protein [Lentisphaerae bacterium]|nr:cupin domain-containing protein [Lentisphaerota bacterium]